MVWKPGDDLLRAANPSARQPVLCPELVLRVASGSDLFFYLKPPWISWGLVIHLNPFNKEVY